MMILCSVTSCAPGRHHGTRPEQILDSGDPRRHSLAAYVAAAKPRHWGDLARAAELWEIATAAPEPHAAATAWLNLGRALRMARQPVAAVDAYRQALQSGQPDTAVQAGQALLDLGMGAALHQGQVRIDPRRRWRRPSDVHRSEGRHRRDQHPDHAIPGRSARSRTSDVATYRHGQEITQENPDPRVLGEDTSTGFTPRVLHQD
jgi:tetratricopeptide (TPR) repeat protein